MHRIILFEDGLHQNFDESSDNINDLVEKVADVIGKSTVDTLLDWHNVLDAERTDKLPILEASRLKAVKETGAKPIVVSWIGAKGGKDNDKIMALVEDVKSGLLVDYPIVIWQSERKNIKDGGKQRLASALGCTVQVDDKWDHIKSIKDVNTSYIKVGFIMIPGVDMAERFEHADKYNKFLADHSEDFDWDRLCREMNKEDRNVYKKCRKAHSELEKESSLVKCDNWEALIKLISDSI